MILQHGLPLRKVRFQGILLCLSIPIPNFHSKTHYCNTEFSVTMNIFINAVNNNRILSLHLASVLAVYFCINMNDGNSYQCEKND